MAKEDIQAVDGWVIVTGVNKRAGKRKLMPRTFAKTRKAAWDQLCHRDFLPLRLSEGFCAVKARLVPIN
jgi:hypothetical protein